MTDRLSDAIKAAREVNVDEICRRFMTAQGYDWDEFDPVSRSRLKEHMRAALKGFAVAPLD